MCACVFGSCVRHQWWCCRGSGISCDRRSRAVTWWWWWWLFPHMRGFLEKWLIIHSPPALLLLLLLFFLFFSFFWSVERLVHSNSTIFLCQDQSTVAQHAEMTVAECYLTSLMWACFRIGSHYAWTAYSKFVGSRLYAYLGKTNHLHFWQKDQGLLRATTVTQGWNGCWIKVSTQSSLWRRKFSRRFCWGLKSQPFYHDSSAVTNKLSRLWLAVTWWQRNGLTACC